MLCKQFFINPAINRIRQQYLAEIETKHMAEIEALNNARNECNAESTLLQIASILTHFDFSEITNPTHRQFIH